MKRALSVKWVMLFAFVVSLFPVGLGTANAATKVVNSRGYQLTIEWKDPKLSPVVRAFALTFKRAYPQMAKVYSPNGAPKQVFVKFEKNDKYPIAYTRENTIYVNPDWAKKNIRDEGMLVHELFHVVDAYPNGVKAPGWFREGMADYARSRYSVIDSWRYPAVKSSQKYSDAYGVTARFFTWLNHIKAPGSVMNIHQSVQNNDYSDDLFKKYTGKTLSQLWAEYQKNPGPVEKLDWKFTGIKHRYNGEKGSRTWKTYMDFTYIPSSKNYIHIRNNSAKVGTVHLNIIRKSDGKSVRTLKTVKLKKGEVVRYPSLSKSLIGLPKGNYVLKVKASKGINFDFEFNYGNWYL